MTALQTGVIILIKEALNMFLKDLMKYSEAKSRLLNYFPINIKS